MCLLDLPLLVIERGFPTLACRITSHSSLRRLGLVVHLAEKTMDFLEILENTTGHTALFCGIAVFTTLVSVYYLIQNDPKKGLPLYGAHYGFYPQRILRYMNHAQPMYLESYLKFRNAIFRITTADGTSRVSCVLTQGRHLRAVGAR